MPNETDFTAWIGRQEQTPADLITPRMLAGYAATFAPHLALSEPVPLGLHWCLSPPTVPAAELGPDGHPLKGGFLPPVPLPRRMWAGSEIELIAPLQLNDEVSRRSEILAVTQKSGRSGDLCFVTVAHEIYTARGLAIRERQTIVYRPAATKAAPPVAPVTKRPVFDHSWQARIDEVMLLRYSGLTFNAHRIHYDYPYVTEIEHYSGLVIHGPLQATLMLNAATIAKGQQPRHFSFRGVSPACGTQTLTVGMNLTDTGADLSVLSEDGVLTMAGEARW